MSEAPAFGARAVYIATLLTSLSLFAVTVAFARGKTMRWTVAGIAVALSFLLFHPLGGRIGLFEAHLAIVNGLFVIGFYLLFDRVRAISFKGSSQELLWALGVTAVGSSQESSVFGPDQSDGRRDYLACALSG